ncbi:MAG: HXXEE domain-containing protein [Vicinamibacterales bacterium]
MSRLQWMFLALIITQAAHSIEEYRGRLYDVFLPARLLSEAISQDRERGFVTVNLTLVAFGLWCFFWPVRQRWPGAIGFVWLWVGIELMNGLGHQAWSIIQGGYTPGVATAPVLFVIALSLAYQLRRNRDSEPL